MWTLHKEKEWWYREQWLYFNALHITLWAHLITGRSLDTKGTTWNWRWPKNHALFPPTRIGINNSHQRTSTPWLHLENANCNGAHTVGHRPVEIKGITMNRQWPKNHAPLSQAQLGTRHRHQVSTICFFLQFYISGTANLVFASKINMSYSFLLWLHFY